MNPNDCNFVHKAKLVASGILVGLAGAFIWVVPHALQAPAAESLTAIPQDCRITLPARSCRCGTRALMYR